MKWLNPIAYDLIETHDSESYRGFLNYETGLPLPGHVGAFGAVRKHHIHEGVDLYVGLGAPVMAVEDGEVVGVIPFTGQHCGSPWWHDTFAVMVEGASGVVVYGEIDPRVSIRTIRAGDLIGHAIKVLKKDTRPSIMLHLELYTRGTRDVCEWLPGTKQPDGLLDPTEYLKGI